MTIDGVAYHKNCVTPELQKIVEFFGLSEEEA